MDYSANQELKATSEQMAREAAQRARTARALAEADRLLAERPSAFLRPSARPTLVFALLCVSAMGLVFWLSGGAA